MPRIAGTKAGKKRPSQQVMAPPPRSESSPTVEPEAAPPRAGPTSTLETPAVTPPSAVPPEHHASEPATPATTDPLVPPPPSPSPAPNQRPPPPPAPVAEIDRAQARQIKHQYQLRLRLQMQEAEELERRAREIERQVRTERRFRRDIEKHSEYVGRVIGSKDGRPTEAITRLPLIAAPNHVQVEFGAVREDLAFVRILYDTENNRYTYEAIEPALNEPEKQILEFIRETLIQTLESHRRRQVPDWEDYLTRAVERVIVDHSIIVDDVSKRRVLYYILRDFFGYGEIDVFMRDPMIEDISCDGPDIPLYLFHRQYESIKTNLSFPNERALDSFVIRLAQRSGKHISIADPLLDATLPDGSRLQATLSKEVTTRGSSFTIRKFRSDPLTPPDLIRAGTMSPEVAAYFWMAMQEGMSLIFGGGTASGKTTTLNAVSTFIPPDRKIVSIEDTREINLRHENWIAGVTRSGFGGEVVAGKVAGEIDMYKLLEAALRQRPEYLLVGEVRGPEAMTLFQAMATGHATYSTLHADSVASAVYRLENPPIRVPRIMLQTLDAVAIQVQVRQNHRLVRRLKEIVEITGFDPQTGDLLTNAVFRWDATSDRFQYYGHSHIFDQIAKINNWTMAQVEAEWTRRKQVLAWLIDHKIRHIDDVSRIISEYYRRPATLMARVTARDPPPVRAEAPPPAEPEPLHVEAPHEQEARP